LNIDVKDTIILSDDNEYIVVSKIHYQNKTYYYIFDKNNIENMKFCIENEDNSISELEDANLVQTLLPIFLRNVTENIPI